LKYNHSNFLAGTQYQGSDEEELKLKNINLLTKHPKTILAQHPRKPSAILSILTRASSW